MAWKRLGVQIPSGPHLFFYSKAFEDLFYVLPIELHIIHPTHWWPLLYPFNNLFNPLLNQVTTVKYEVQLPGRVRLQLFSKTGALVATLFDGVVTAGKGSVDWNGRNLAGHVVASGVYLLRLEGPGGAQTTRKVVVVK